VSVAASDSAGISSVDFYLDSEFIGTGRAHSGGIWTLKRDFSEFASGKHQLTAVVKDMIGSAPGAWRVPHVITLEPKTVTIDKTAPRASVKVSAKGRGVTVKTAQVSEAATMKVSIDSKTIESASLKKLGSQTVKHSVPQREVMRQTRRVKWSVRLTDAVGNSRTYSGYVTVRYWDLIKRGGRSVQLVIY
jgi:hypothetical protein